MMYARNVIQYSFVRLLLVRETLCVAYIMYKQSHNVTVMSWSLALLFENTASAVCRWALFMMFAYLQHRRPVFGSQS